MSNERLTFLARYVLTYIKFRTNNNYQLFESNDTIAQKLGYKTDSIRVIVNKLIREGYIIKNIDDKGRRNLSLSGKEFLPLDGVNMSSLDKRILKQDAQNQEREAISYKQQYENSFNIIQVLKGEITEKNKQIFALQAELMELKEKLSNPTPICRTEKPIEQQEVQAPKQPQPVISQEVLDTLPMKSITINTSGEPTQQPNQSDGITPEEALAQIFGQFALQQGLNNDYNE